LVLLANNSATAPRRSGVARDRAFAFELPTKSLATFAWQPE
jgi:hypothetical protein